MTLAEVYYDQGLFCLFPRDVTVFSVKSDSACLLFARALYLNGNPLQAYEQLEKHGAHTAETRYFLAKVAFDLRK